ncbi:MAG TPA: DUF4381 family protein [Gemmatimonadaceae bacterium]|nr:DUF4381 family protein [Gemmatimonadaceae bacterium]
MPVVLAAQQAPSVRYGITKSRDTVTVGEAFDIRVRFRAPADAEVRFPENPDTSGTVQGRDPRTIQVVDSIESQDLIATYHVAAWDVGLQSVRLGDVVVTFEGVDRSVTLDGVSVFVRSVLPADSALRVPKPARDIFSTRPFPWWLIAALLAAVAIGLLLWWWMRRKRQPVAPVIVDPYVRAMKELTRVEAMGLVDAGERTRFAALVVEVVRDYLAARFPDAPLALTSRELVVLLRRHPTVPLEQLSRMLHEADLAKFAAWTLTEERARALSRDARAIVEHEHKTSQPPPMEAAA